MLTFDELWELLTVQDESQLIEAKYGSEVGKSCWETISAFANEPGMGGGYLLLGIQSPSNSPSGEYEIAGVDDPDKIQGDLTAICNNPDSFNHPIRPNIKLETKDGKTIVIAHIPEASPIEKPIYSKSRGLPQGARRRIGSSDIRCTDSDLELFYQERQNQSYDTTSVPEFTIDDLDPNAINAYRQARQKLNPSASELTYNDQDLLYSLNAITRHPQNPQAYCPTVAGLILFGKAIALRRYFPMHRIDYILISGTEWVSDPDERYQVVVEMREPLLLAVPRLTALVINDLPKSFHLDENGLQRQEIPLIPSKVIREAIVNAVMHRNYRLSSPIQIIRYTNRLEIHNPGYSLKPVDEIDQPGSLTRNEKIAAVLHETGFAETKGTGGRVMLETMLEANLSLPRFDSQRERDRFCLTLWTHNLLGEEDTEWLKQFRDYNLSNEDARALVVLRQVGRIDNFMYRIANGVDTLDASKKLIRLRDAGILEANGKGRATYYTLATQFLSGELGADNLESSTDDGALSGELGADNLESSTDDGTLSGELGADNLESSGAEQASSASEPLQLELAIPMGGIPQSLQEKIQSLGKRSPSLEEVKEVIIELCALQPKSSNELATLLNRDQKYLLEKYLKPLVEKGLLEYTNPERPNDPNQRYQIP